MIKLFAITSFLLWYPIIADTLILKTGVFFKGKTISQSSKEIVFKDATGKENSYAKNLVLKVIYKDLNALEVKKIVQQETKKEESKNNSSPPINTEAMKNEKELTETEDKKELKKSSDIYAGNRWSPVWRSSIIPGWGQWYGKQRILGLGIGIIFLGTVSYLGASYQEMNNNLAARDTASRNGNLFLIASPPSLSSFGSLYITQQIYADQSKKAEANYNTSVVQVVTAIGVVAAVYTIQILHSIYLGNKLVNEREKKIKEINSTGFNIDSKIERVIGVENNQLNTIVNVNYAIHF
ncbi:MAG: hypothetical protein SFU98_12115 [Leptospiraceae bacterium]|nr:hypothetical protein [Leptospiraceae bacterium]